MSKYILVIKHGALGDVVLATGPFQAIREHHADAHITLLTTKPYAKLLQNSPYFDEIWVDIRPKLWQISDVLALRKMLRSRQFDWVYDLQTSSRSSQYLKLLQAPKPQWSGVASGCSHPHDNPNRAAMHTVERQREQLQMAGIPNVPQPNLDWLSESVDDQPVKKPYILLVPGGSAHRPAKRWPSDAYGALASYLADVDIQPVLIGAGAESGILSNIERQEPRALNLCNQTSFAQIAELARHANYAVGNDTGPMHIIAAAGCSSTVLFSHESDPKRCAPRGSHVSILRELELAQLPLETVVAELDKSRALRKG